MRKRIFEIIEISKDNDKASFIYDMCMMFAIILSLIPLAFKETNRAFIAIEYATGAIYVVDYILRVVTADYKLEQKFGGGG